MIYLIGVNHEFQFLSQRFNKNGEKLRAYLEKAIDKYSPTAIIEEFSEDARTLWEATEVIAESLAQKHGLPHVFLRTDEK